MFYYTIALGKRETSQVERKENVVKLLCEDKGPDNRNMKIHHKCNT